MYEMSVIGIRKVEGTNKSTGRAYSGWNVFVTYENKYVDGLAAERLYLSDAKMPQNLGVGSVIRPYYNRFGQVEMVEVL